MPQKFGICSTPAISAGRQRVCTQTERRIDCFAKLSADEVMEWQVFAVVHESAYGTKRTSMIYGRMPAFKGKADMSLAGAA